MRLRDGRCLGLFLLSTQLPACQSLLDLDVAYRDCVDIEDQRYVEQFRGESLQSLGDRCWRVANADNAPSGIEQKIFIEAGDLVMRVDDALGGSDLDEWTKTDQAPFLYRRIHGDFLIVTRAEAASKVAADHCLKPGNAAGLALRPSDNPTLWATWTVEPYLWDKGATKAECKEDEIQENDPTATVRVRTSETGWPEASFEDVGIDGEADIAICRVDDRVYYYYGEATADPTRNAWLPLGAEVPSHAVGPGPVDLGLTAAGTAPDFQVAGHFNWVVLERGVFGDGCAGALEVLTLPEDD